MPHCIVEHADTINGESLISNVFYGTLKSGLFENDGSDIKVRAKAYSHHQTGEEKSDFVHVTLKILDGRNDEQKTKLSQSVLRQLNQLELQNCSITVEVVDMQRASYVKRLT